MKHFKNEVYTGDISSRVVDEIEYASGEKAETSSKKNKADVAFVDNR
jgi:hypothetical protein